jgi:Flp pilus assembly protein TadG
MRRSKLDSKLLRDISGAVLVETTIVLPMFLLLVLGTIDVTYMFFEWALANKAAYVGARTAVVSDPVATRITNLNYTESQLQLIGQPCFDNAGNNVNCPLVPPTVCTSIACTPNTFGFDSTAFKTIFDRMKVIFPRLQLQNVTITYQTNDSGFVGQPYVGNSAQFSLPLNVTVSITDMTHQFYFVGPLVRLFGGFFPAKSTMPTFATTLQSEDMDSSNN